MSLRSLYNMMDASTRSWFMKTPRGQEFADQLVEEAGGRWAPPEYAGDASFESEPAARANAPKRRSGDRWSDSSE